jgi:thiamine-monophosphate kinase
LSANTPHKESDLIRSIATGLPRHPLQLNKLLEADAEIIGLTPGGREFLVVKTDAVHEEIREKLYSDPWLIGWMAITAPCSDIASTGATLTGILLSLVLPREYSPEWMREFNNGIVEACSAYHTYVLGGDTNFSEEFSISVTAIAQIDGERPMLRKGINPGDRLYSTGLLGLGSAYAYGRMVDKTVHSGYRPRARFREAKIINPYATSSIDTSDGLFPALAVLSEINQVGFEFCLPPEAMLHPDANFIQTRSGLPAWTLLAGPHGEYEILFTVPENDVFDFEDHCEKQHFQPMLLAKATEEKKISFLIKEKRIESDPSRIANFYLDSNRNVAAYIDILNKQHQAWTI